MSINQDEILEIDGKEYVVYSKINDKNDTYLFLISNFRPIEIKIAKVLSNEPDIELELIEEKLEKERIIALFNDEHVL